MISDLDETIMANFLRGRVIIDTFEIDHNCSEINVPYTPFQQLLSIMPIKSIGLLPPGYGQIAKNDLKRYFPLDFDIDLNGRALPWEAACLIPFIDEKSFIEHEAMILGS
jgi:5'-3' exonuclease